jgi:hypothetical protein
MNDSVINNLPAHWPMYGILFIVASIAIGATVKVFFSANDSSLEKRKEWNLSGRLDADGIPVLADDLRRPSGGFPYPTQTSRRPSR